MIKDWRACITLDTFLVRTGLLSIPWSTEVGSPFLDSSRYSLELTQSTVFHDSLWPLMLFFTQMQVSASFLGSCLSEIYVSHAGQTGLDASVSFVVGFAFFSGLESFEILGEESDRDVDFSLSLLLLPSSIAFSLSLPHSLTF